jgi:hypothetical protein
VQLSYDQIDLVLEISYHGALLPQEAAVLGPREALAGELPFEPEIAGSWRCFCPDPITCDSRGADCRIRLVF